MLKVANERIDNAPNARTRQQRSELLHFIQFMHGTGCRVDEARNIRVGDCTVKERQDPEELTHGAVSHAEVNALLAENVYLSISVRTSKTGQRTTLSRPSAVPAYRAAAAGKRPTDPLFSEHHRDAFRELLIAANLRTNPFGHPRNAKCLRPSAISHWLIDRPQIPLSWLAANVGTSIQMLNDFYLRRLGVQLDGSAWL